MSGNEGASKIDTANIGMVSTNGRTFTALRGGITMRRTGKKAAGRELDGRKWDQFPEVKR